MSVKLANMRKYTINYAVKSLLRFDLTENLYRIANYGFDNKCVSV